MLRRSSFLAACALVACTRAESPPQPQPQPQQQPLQQPQQQPLQQPQQQPPQQPQPPQPQQQPPQPPPQPPLVAATETVSGAAGDTDVRVMLAEIASAKACEVIEGQFIGLPAPDRPNVMTGVLWIHHCKISNEGTRVTFELSGSGWQWAEQKKHKAGGTFTVHQYVRFSVDARLHGALDIAYDQPNQVMSLWFSPSQRPKIEFTPIGDVEVDSQGLWSSMIGAASSVFTDSPTETGTREAKQRGTQRFASQLAEGLTFAIDLCTGNQRSTLGRVPKGSMGKPGVGQSRRISVEIEPGGLMVFGPLHAQDGMIVDVQSDGPVRVGLACADQARPAAEAFAAGRPPPAVPTLGQADVRGHGRIEIQPTGCMVAFVARSISKAKVTFDWVRPPGEQALSTGGPIIRCARSQDENG